MMRALSSNTTENNPIVGVVGGGQLAQMLVDSSIKHNVELFVQTPSTGDPAALKARRTLLAETNDLEATSKLLSECCSVTFENEWIDVEELVFLEEEGGCFLPSLSSLKPLVDKISQRKLLNKLQIPGPKWISLTSVDSNDVKLPTGWSFPVMAKSARGGYDGKGTRVLHTQDDLKNLFEIVDRTEWLLEAWIPFETELAVVASRDIEGTVRLFPLCETNQTQQICNWTLVPADVSHEVEALVYNIAASILTELDYVGVMAIEFFYGSNGLLVNEIAPRTHNSGHYSIEACSSSQFDQQICIAAGLAVPMPEMLVQGALMVNLLGLPNGEGDSCSLNERLQRLRDIKGAHLHWYEKLQERPGRKLGHVTVLLNEGDIKNRREEALKVLAEIRSIWPMFSQ